MSIENWRNNVQIFGTKGTNSVGLFELKNSSLDAICHEMGQWIVSIRMDQQDSLGPEVVSVPFRIFIELMLLRGVIKYPPKEA